MFCTVSVTRGSRCRLRGQARPSAVFRTGRPSCTSTHTGAECTEPSGRMVETRQKFLACSSSSLRPSIVALIGVTFLSGDGRTGDAHHDRAFGRECHARVAFSVQERLGVKEACRRCGSCWPIREPVRSRIGKDAVSRRRAATSYCRLVPVVELTGGIGSSGTRRPLFS